MHRFFGGDLRLASIWRSIWEASDALQADDLAGHSLRVSNCSERLAELSGVDRGRSETIGRAALFHDAGKLLVPSSVILKPEKLTDEERSLMQSHSKHGWDLLAGPDTLLRRAARNMALSHHERFDGAGYPNGLDGGKIPFEARIVALADVYDALRSKRNYKPGLTHTEACDAIAGRHDQSPAKQHFDPALRKVFLENDGEIKAAWESAALSNLAKRMAPHSRAEQTRTTVRDTAPARKK